MTGPSRPGAPWARARASIARYLAVLGFFGIALVFEALPALAQPSTPGAERTGVKEDRGSLPMDRRLLAARIQSDLERVAAALPRQALPDIGTRAPEEIAVEVYQAFLAGDIRALDRLLAQVAEVTAQSRALLQKRLETGLRVPELDDEIASFDRIAATGWGSTPLHRVIQAFEWIGASLSLWAMVDHLDRSDAQPLALAGVNLRLPCRTLSGRAAELASLIERDKRYLPLQSILSCPTETNDPTAAERLLRDPSSIEMRHVASFSVFSADPNGLPWPFVRMAADPSTERENAIARMDEDPVAVEPALEAAAAQDALGKLDLALFLHTFRPASASRDMRIDGLLRDVLAAVPAARLEETVQTLGARFEAYDGSDASLLPAMVLASFTGAAAIAASPYPPAYLIPCAVLLARPALLEGTKPFFDAGSDNFLPRSGCLYGRGKVKSFPTAEIAAYLSAADAAGRYHPSMRRADLGSLTWSFCAMQIGLPMTHRHQALDYPYQLWGYADRRRYQESQQIKARYETARSALVRYYLGRGMPQDKATESAQAALFGIVFDPARGFSFAPESLRVRLLQGAGADEIERGLENGSVAIGSIESEASADRQPLLHLAVDDPEVLRVVLKRLPDVDGGGFTPLMQAASTDRLASAQLLIARGARVDAIGSNGQTALMYAAAKASFPMIAALLAAGADPFRADADGRRAVDHLRDNRKLTPEERSRAAKLLF